MQRKRPGPKRPPLARKLRQRTQLKIMRIGHALDRAKSQPMRPRQPRHARRLHIHYRRSINIRQPSLLAHTRNRSRTRQRHIPSRRRRKSLPRRYIDHRARLHHRPRDHPRHTSTRQPRRNQHSHTPVRQRSLHRTRRAFCAHPRRDHHRALHPIQPDPTLLQPGIGLYPPHQRGDLTRQGCDNGNLLRHSFRSIIRAREPHLPQAFSAG